jgi:hypothetical protein
MACNGAALLFTLLYTLCVRLVMVAVLLQSQNKTSLKYQVINLQAVSWQTLFNYWH